MSVATITRPAASEHAPYYSLYIDKVGDGDIVTILTNQLNQTRDLLNGLTVEQGSLRYEPGKWSIKEVVGHLIDCERIMAYRALRFARNDKTPIEGFEQDDYMANVSFDSYSMKDLIDEFTHIRQASILFFKGLTEEASKRTGLANNNEISVRALAYIIAGHEFHHIDIVRKRYL